MLVRADKERIRDAERRCGRRCRPLRRWFNRRLRGGGIDQGLVRSIAEAAERLEPGLPHPRAVASHYLAAVGATAASFASGMGQWEERIEGLDRPSLAEWLRSADTGVVRGANLYRGFWRGDESGDVLALQPPCSIAAMGDGNCFYRSVGVAMALSFPAALEARLSSLEYHPLFDSAGLSVRYPPVVDEREVAEWNDDNRRLRAGLGQPVADTLAWLNAVPAMDVALVRAMRELTARELERRPPDPASLREDVAQTELGTIAGASERAGEAYADVILADKDSDLQANYRRHIVRQMWEDALTSCYAALGRALDVTIAIHQTLPRCDDASQDRSSVHLHHHGFHFDIWRPPGGGPPPPWSCAACTLDNPPNLPQCEACGASRENSDPPSSGAGPSSGASPEVVAVEEDSDDSEEDVSERRELKRRRKERRKKRKRRRAESKGKGRAASSSGASGGWVDLTGESSDEE